MFLLASCSEVANRKPSSPSAVEVENRKVSALARLIPKGDLVKLSIPASTTITGNEVVEHWFIEEGSFIKKGDKLLQLSSKDELTANLLKAQADLKESELYLPFLIKEKNRAVELTKTGAFPKEDADRAISNVNIRIGMINAAKAAVHKAKTSLEQSVIRSPLTGKLIQIYSWPGMRETDNGLALIGRTNEMEAWAQVFQADLPLLRIGQHALIQPEDQGFEGEIKGVVKSIIGEISQKDLFAINANNDVNARVALVKVSINEKDSKKLQNLSGLNVIVRFQN